MTYRPCGFHTCADPTFAEALSRLYAWASNLSPAERDAAVQVTRELWAIVRGFGR